MSRLLTSPRRRLLTSPRRRLLAPPRRRLLAPCGVCRALLGYDAPVLVLHQITLGQATWGVFGCSVPNAPTRADLTHSLRHYISPRKFQAEGLWPLWYIFVEPRLLNPSTVHGVCPGTREFPHGFEPICGSTAMVNQEIELDFRVDLDAQKVLV